MATKTTRRAYGFPTVSEVEIEDELCTVMEVGSATPCDNDDDPGGGFLRVALGILSLALAMLAASGALRLIGFYANSH